MKNVFVPFALCFLFLFVYSGGCWYDYLEIRDGYWRESPLLGKIKKFLSLTMSKKNMGYGVSIESNKAVKLRAK